MEKIKCTIERVTFQNPENGYSVLQATIKGYREEQTIVGTFHEVTVGAVLTIEGNWRVDKRYGRQFAAQIAHISVTCLQHNILSVAKRFSDYETIGELFRGTKADALEITIAERVLDFIIEVAAKLEDICDSNTDKLIDNLINKPESMEAFVKMYEKLAA